MADANTPVPGGNGQNNNTALAEQKGIVDADGNEISKWGKRKAGFLLILITAIMVLALIAHWPNKMPSPTASYARYSYKLFHVTLVDQDGKPMEGISTDSAIIRIVGLHKDSLAAMEQQADSIENQLTDSTDESAGDSALMVLQLDTLSKKINSQKAVMAKGIKAEAGKASCYIDLNTLIMILVAIAGFLSNMIHIASSFTNFIGEGKFKRSWILWYFVKPFTASALAVAVYVIFRAGFLNASDVATNVNLYGVVAISILAGLFTDMATLKLKEVFGVIFNTSTQRRDAMENVPVKITGVSPKTLRMNNEENIVISGSGFDKNTLVIKINGQEVAQSEEADANAVYLKYTATTAGKQKLVIYDDKGKVLATKELEAEDSSDPAPAPPAAAINVNSVDPTAITTNIAAPITITGSGLDTAGITVKMGTQDIDLTAATVSATAITFNYTATADGATDLIVADKDGKEINKTTITASAGQ
jgi:IPT/TIG domain